ncbi:MAG: DNA repair protein RadC [Chloroflexi bacterium]|nr:DNA repair protein RadC [Chloroflexota bacterium]
MNTPGESANKNPKRKNVDKPHYLGHRKRLRDRFRKAGGEGLRDYEMLELLLGYAVPRRDVKPLAKQLITRFGSLAGVLDASFEELQGAAGLSPTSATLIKLVKEIGVAQLAERMKHRDLLRSPQSVVDFARLKLAGYPHEAFMAIYMNTKNEVIDYEMLHEGTVDRAIIYPRRIVEAALSHHAAALLLVHNHPSGHTEPSEEDKDVTRTVIQAAGTVDIRVLDHVIVARDGYLSFLEKGLLPGAG